MDLRTLNKEERYLIIMMEPKKILWDYIKSLLQDELNSESYVVEKHQYRRRIKSYTIPESHISVIERNSDG